MDGIESPSVVDASGGSDEATYRVTVGAIGDVGLRGQLTAPVVRWVGAVRTELDGVRFGGRCASESGMRSPLGA